MQIKPPCTEQTCLSAISSMIGFGPAKEPYSRIDSIKAQQVHLGGSGLTYLYRQMRFYRILKNGSAFVLKAFGWFYLDDDEHLALEYANAGSLKYQIENPRYSGHSLTKIRYIAANLVLGIRFIHSKSIVHQAILANNIKVPRQLTVDCE